MTDTYDYAGLLHMIGPSTRQTYTDITHGPHDPISRIYAWVKHRGRLERGAWCVCTLHDRLLVLLNLAEIDYLVQDDKVKFTLPDHLISASVYQLELWWMRVNLGV